MLRRTLLASASAAALTSAAQAADLTPSPPPPLVFNWNGFYVGVNVGADIPNDHFSTFPGGTLLTIPFMGSLGWGQTTTSSNGNIAGGGQIGFNWQPTPSVVLGLEADLQGSAAKDSINSVFASNAAPETGIVANNFSSHRAWFGTVRGRVGFMLNSYPQLMIYATGGLAYGENSRSGSTTIFTTAGALNEFFPFGNISDFVAGYTVGGGVEWAFLPNWSVKAEYLFVKLPSDAAFIPTAVLGQGALPTDIMSFHHSSQDSVIRLGLNYKFNWWPLGPIVASY